MFRGFSGGFLRVARRWKEKWFLHVFSLCEVSVLRFMVLSGLRASVLNSGVGVLKFR
jgi:hypothetical protein